MGPRSGGPGSSCQPAGNGGTWYLGSFMPLALSFVSSGSRSRSEIGGTTGGGRFVRAGIARRRIRRRVGGGDGQGVVDALGQPAQLGGIGDAVAAAAQLAQTVRGVLGVAGQPGAVADQGRERRQVGRGGQAALGAGQHRVLDRAQPHLAPGREHQLLDQVGLGGVHGLPAGQ